MIATLEVRGVPVQVEVHGEGTPLLMVHGWGVDRRLMTGCTEPLFAGGDDGWQRIYPDLPGMGGTPGDPRVDGSDAMVEVLLGVLDAVAPGEPFALMGESYGGYLSRGVVAARPSDVLGLALVCPVADPDHAIRRTEPLVVVEPDPALLAELDPADAEAFASLAVRQGRPWWERFAAEVLPGVRAADQDYLDQVLDPARRLSTTDVPLERPVLVITGRQDSTVGFRDQWDLLDLYPRSTYVVLDRAGHNAHYEQPEVFGALVREWLDRVALDRLSRA